MHKIESTKGRRSKSHRYTDQMRPPAQNSFFNTVEHGRAYVTKAADHHDEFTEMEQHTWWMFMSQTDKYFPGEFGITL